MSDLTSKERPQFVPAVRKPKLPYLCSGAECVTCKRPVSGDWGLVPDECDTCDAERRARYYRECAQWADAEIDRLTKRIEELENLDTSHLPYEKGWQDGRADAWEAYNAGRAPQEATGLQCEKDGVCALVSRNDDEWHCTACNGDFVRKQPVEPQGWQPIETAPRGNVMVLLRTPGSQRGMVDYGFRDMATDKFMVQAALGFEPVENFGGEASHWMPMPSAALTKLGVESK